MIAWADLYVGAIVMLASGSIRMVVTGLDDEDRSVAVVGWGFRIGMVTMRVPFECLSWPRERSAAPDPAVEAEA